MDTANITQPQFELPCNVFAEQVVLGNLIEDAAPLPAILATGLSAGDFILSDHRRVFQAVLDLRHVNAPVDYISVADRLGNSADDFALILDLRFGVVVEISHALYHAKIVKTKALFREILKICEWIPQAVSNVGDPKLVIAQIRQKLDACSELPMAVEYGTEMPADASK